MDFVRSVSIDNGKTWTLARTAKHQDASQGVPPIVAIERVDDGKVLRVNSVLFADWVSKTPSDPPGVDERMQPVEQGFTAQDGRFLVLATSAWERK